MKIVSVTHKPDRVRGFVTVFGEVRQLNAATIRRCPHYIMIPEHYNPDQTCRCTDPEHDEMLAWGYRWDETENVWK